MFGKRTPLLTQQTARQRSLLTTTSDVAGGIEWEDYGLDYAKTIPEYDVTDTNFTCGRLAFEAAKKTQTADVFAGNEVSFRVNQGWEDMDPSALYVSLKIFAKSRGIK
jgi:hypothetical protein